MARVLIIEARFYNDIADMALDAAKNILRLHNVEYDIITVSGALEIPHAVNIASGGKEYEGIISLGCIIKGETDHYEIISKECIRCLNDVAIPYDLATGFGVIVALDKQQAYDRATVYAERAANACLELIRIKERFSQFSHEPISAYKN